MRWRRLAAVLTAPISSELNATNSVSGRNVNSVWLTYLYPTVYAGDSPSDVITRRGVPGDVTLGDPSCGGTTLLSKNSGEVTAAASRLTTTTT